jgi:hypothetical protein
VYTEEEMTEIANYSDSDMYFKLERSPSTVNDCLESSHTGISQVFLK